MTEEAVPNRDTKPPSVAEYQGIISRWCAVMGKVPDTGKGFNRARAELDALDEYLAHIAKLNLDSEGDWRF